MNTDEKCLFVTIIAFLLSMIYYYVYRPSYVKDDKENNENKDDKDNNKDNNENKDKKENLSVRKCLIYSMLWSSAIGLLFLFAMIFYSEKSDDNNNKNNNKNNNNNKNKFSVEPPTFRS